MYKRQAIDSDEGRVNDAIDMVTDAQIGDATNEHFVESLGVGNFDLCVVAIGDVYKRQEIMRVQRKRMRKQKTVLKHLQMP